jgi:general secretion pathway protein N
MRPGTLVLVGIAAYSAFLVALMPASFVAGQVAQGSRGAFQLHDASGTLWKGQGRATLATPAGPLAIDSLAWRFLPARLLAGRLGFAIEGIGAGLTTRGEVDRSFTTWEARGLTASGKASGVASLLPLLAPWRPEGTLEMAAPRLTFDNGEVRGEARVEWRQASVALSEVRPLGTYRAELRGDGGPAKVTLATLEGPLRITGQGTITPPGRFAFSGEARGEGAAAASLQPLLDLLGPRRADGARAIELLLR